MKILCLSDLHIGINNDFRLIEDLINNNKFNVIVITGDIFEGHLLLNPYKELEYIFEGCQCPVICTLGNHEFFYHSTKEVLNQYKNFYEPKSYIHYLDIIGYYDIGNVRFLGNMLGYDNSICHIDEKKFLKWGNNQWKDRFIKNWNNEYLTFTYNCQQQIINNISNNRLNILCTHTVPHEKLNMHEDSEFNCYSGLKNFLEIYKFDYSISGHTHKRTIGQQINDCWCINTGSNYHEIEYFILEF